METSVVSYREKPPPLLPRWRLFRGVASQRVYPTGTDAISAAGAVAKLGGLCVMYHCPATNIRAPNAIANIALANWERSVILFLYRNIRIRRLS
jgi:hypothetical protein